MSGLIVTPLTNRRRRFLRSGLNRERMPRHSIVARRESPKNLMRILQGVDGNVCVASAITANPRAGVPPEIRKQIMNQISPDQQQPSQRRNDFRSAREHTGLAQPTSDASPPITKGGAARFSAATLLLFGGFALAIVSSFLTWETMTATVSALDTPLYTETKIIGLSAAAKFAVLAVIGVAVWLAWPIVVKSSVSAKRLAGLSGVALLSVLFSVGWLVSVSGDNTNGVSASVGFGYLLYTAAAIAIAVGIVRTWMNRSKTQ